MVRFQQTREERTFCCSVSVAKAGRRDFELDEVSDSKLVEKDFLLQKSDKIKKK